jgi:regulator of protease activity HflC (stomatin/prohibitin superfamily)
MSAETVDIWLVSLIMVGLIIVTMYAMIQVIKPYEVGLRIILGKYTGKINPGLNMVPPFITKVIRMDLRQQLVDVPDQEFITGDKVPVRVDASVALKVVDPEKAAFQAQDHRALSTEAAMSHLRLTISELDLRTVLDTQKSLLSQFRDVLDKETDPWGVKVEHIYVRRIDPGREVLEALEKRTIAQEELEAAEIESEITIVEAQASIGRVLVETGGAVDRAARVRRAREALELLPKGLPESLWGWKAEDLAEAIVDGEGRTSRTGMPLVSIKGQWYYNDPRDMSIFMQECKDVGNDP